MNEHRNPDDDRARDEAAEAALAETASHGDPAPDPTELAGEPEVDDPDAEYGEPDRVEPSE